MLRFLLRLAPAFVIYSVANAQAPPVTLDVPGGSPTDVIGSPPDSPRNSSHQVPKLKTPDGFGGLKEDPAMLEGAPDETGSVMGTPNPPLNQPKENGQP